RHQHADAGDDGEAAPKQIVQRGNVLGLSLYDLFRGSLTVIAGIGVLMAIVMFFPRFVRDLIHRVAEGVGRRSRRVADRLERLRRGIDDAHASVIAFNSPGGWLTLLWATILSAPSHANKLLAGYVALR